MIAHDRTKRLTERSVLVVEPHADLRTGIVGALQQRNYVCDAVGTPEDAALMLRDHDYAYVVVDLDVSRPSSDLVSSVPEQSSVILITDDIASDDEYDVLRKPFSRDELLAHFVRR